MTRRLMDADPRREQRRQSLLLDRLEGIYSQALASEIERASMELVTAYQFTGQVAFARDHRDNLEGIFKLLVTQSMLTFGARILSQGKAIGLVLEKKESFSDFMMRVALEYVTGELIRERITNIGNTTREDIVAAVQSGYEEGLSVDQIAQNIRKKIPGMSQLRGALIARTETHGAANAGSYEAAKDLGLDLKKEWLAGMDRRTRLTHSLADGQIVNMDEAFTVGSASLMYPGDPSGPAEEIINCRCSVSYIVDDD